MDTDRIKSACSETLVLRLLEDRDMHGYEMCAEIEERSDGYFRLKHSTLYPLLHRLEKAGFVKSRWSELDSGKPRKVYALTKKGRKHQKEAIASWRALRGSLEQLIPELAS